MARTHAARPREIIWARHGETQANAAKRLKPPNEPLDAHGRRQAESLANRVKSVKPDRIVSSPLVRGNQTAQIVGRAIHKPVSVMPQLRSRNYGDWAGKPISEVKPQLKAGETPPHGESKANVIARAKLAKRKLEKMPGKTLAITHSSVLRAAHPRKGPHVGPARYMVEDVG